MPPTAMMGRRIVLITAGRRSVNGAIGLFVPKTVIRERCKAYMSKGVPAQRGPLLFDDDFTIVAKYGALHRGFVQYYLLAQDVFRLEKLRWVMETSMLKTLAGKHKSTVTKMARKYKTTIDTGAGARTCFQVMVQQEGRKPLVARFGGGARYASRGPGCKSTTSANSPTSTNQGDEKPEWVRLMAKRQRKTLVVCERCHQNIHAGRATATTRK